MAAKPAASPSIHRLDVGAYDRMVASGALEGQPVELLEGLVVDMSPQSPEHAAVMEDLVRHLGQGDARLRVQSPLAIPPDSEPEPDLALVAERPPAGSHPQTALMVVEIAVSSHWTDRGTKVDLYARAGVPVYWIVDVPGRTVEVRTEPRDGAYQRCEIYRAGDDVPPPGQGLDGLAVAALFESLDN